MTTAIADLTGLLEGIPPGAWVAVSEEKNAVVAYGVDAQAVLHEAHAKGEGHPLMMRVPDYQTAMFL